MIWRGLRATLFSTMILGAALGGCGDDAPSELPRRRPEPERDQAASSGTPAPEPTARDGLDQDPESLTALLTTIGTYDANIGYDPHPPPVPTLAEAIHDCEDYDEGNGLVCDVQTTAAVDPEGVFIALMHTGVEVGPPTLLLVRDDGETSRSVLSFAAFGAPLPTLRRRLRRYGRLAALPNLISARAHVELGLGGYAALAVLSGPLDGWVLWYDKTNIDVREDRLHLVRRDGTDDRVLGSRPSRIGPCDANGRWCEINNTDQDAECTDAMLAAEGRLCTLPTSMTYVTLAPNGLLLMIGHEVTPADHFDETPPVHWTVVVPDDLRP